MEKQQSIKVSEEVYDWYTEKFGSSRQGMISIVEGFHREMQKNPILDKFQTPSAGQAFLLGAWKQMWRHSLVTLKGVFTQAELCLVIDVYNATALSPLHYGNNSLAHNMSDSIDLDWTAEKWDVVPTEVLAKVYDLTPTQAICLEIWANGFWYGDGNAKREGSELDLAKYVAQLV